MKVLRKIIIAICLGIATCLGYKSYFPNSDVAIGIVPAIIATGSAIAALFINDLVDVIKQKK